MFLHLDVSSNLKTPTTAPPPRGEGAPLEALLLHLLLGGSDGVLGVGVLEPAALLAVLQRRGLGAADADLRVLDLGAARRRAVRVRDAPARDELGAVPGADVGGARVVGGQAALLGEADGGDCAGWEMLVRVGEDWGGRMERKKDGEDDYVRARMVTRVKRMVGGLSWE